MNSHGTTTTLYPAARVCRKCGSEVSERNLTCPGCGAAQTPDALISNLVMKALGLLSGVTGVGLVVFSDQLVTNGPIAHPYDFWRWALLFIEVGFLTFYRKWKEEREA